MDFYETECEHCGKTFERHCRQNPEYKIKAAKKVGKTRTRREFCSKECFYEFYNKSSDVACGWCNKIIRKSRAEQEDSKSGLCFCNRSCSASYNNTQRRRGRRSKCEIMLFEMLVENYGSRLEVLPNDKMMLGGLEVDIGIPAIQLAIEWNGIVHFEPIFGEEEMNRIQCTDAKKLRLAREKGINLIVVPDLVSTKKHVVEAYHSICRVIDGLLLGFPE